MLSPVSIVRNYDLSNKQTTSRISHHVFRVDKRNDVINCAKGYSIPFKNNKFIEEIFWRVYFVAILKRIHLFGLRIKESSKYT